MKMTATAGLSGMTVSEKTSLLGFENRELTLGGSAAENNCYAATAKSNWRAKNNNKKVVFTRTKLYN